MSTTASHKGIAGKDTTDWALLGLLRFLFASVVVVSHTASFLPLPKWLMYVKELGDGEAVLLFFVVSGYSISHSYLAAPVGFYERRLQRLYPIYLFGLVLACVPYLVFGPAIHFSFHGDIPAPTSVWPLLANSVFLQCYATKAVPTFGVTWSLAIEVLFYALAPLLLRASSRLLAVLVGVSALLYVFHSALGAEFGDPMPLRSLFYAWPWLLGVLLYRHRQSRRVKNAAMFGMGGAVSLFTISQGKFAVFFCMVSVWLIGQAASRPHLVPVAMRGVQAAKLSKWLGNLSYPIYITHIATLCLVLGGGDTVRPVWQVLGAIFLVSVLAYFLVDAPYQAYAKRRRSVPVSRVQERRVTEARQKT